MLLRSRVLLPRVKGQLFSPSRFNAGTPLLKINKSNFASKTSIRFNSSSSTKTSPPKKKRSLFKNAFLGLSSVGLGCYLYDTYFGSDVTRRAFRSLSTLLLISVDYKMNFNKDYDIAALHERNSQRLYDLLIANKGLYIKIGQMIAVQGVMFPKQYQEKFSQLFDKAPKEDWSTVNSILKIELGENYRDETFEYIHETPIASASIAQVHKAKLKSNGQEVAVKVQKHSVSQQVDVDLLTYQFVMAIYEWVFEMPIYTTVQYVCKKMREELDFQNELKNGDLVSELIESNPKFKGNIYIPKYYPEVSTKKVLVAEWINGESISKYTSLKDLGYNVKQLTESIIQVYSKQVFEWGVVHCDLHPGNLLVRKVKEGNKTKQQLVILDHGLYEHFTDKFQREYSEFWKYTMEFNSEKVNDILRGWGINADEIMLAMTTMKPGSHKAFKEHMKKMKKLTYYERQLLIKQRMKTFFENTDKFPLAMVFLMRSMRIVQGLNRNFGSPCNRIDILATEANESVKRLTRKQTISTFNDRYLSLKRFFIYMLIKLGAMVQFNLNKFNQLIVNHLLQSKNKVADLEEVYENNLIESGKGFGFDEVPTTNDLLK